MSATIMLADPTGTIVAEVADRKSTQTSVALTYALAIRDEQSVPVDWPTVNTAIRSRWGAGGLERVKKLAWSRFRATP